MPPPFSHLQQLRDSRAFQSHHFPPRAFKTARVLIVSYNPTAYFLLHAWLRPAGSLSCLPRRDRSLRSGGSDPAMCLRVLRFRSALRREDIGQGGRAAAGPVTRRSLQGGDGQRIADTPRTGRPRAASPGRRRRQRRQLPHKLAGVGADPVLRATRAKGRRRMGRRGRRRPTTSTCRDRGRTNRVDHAVRRSDRRASGFAEARAGEPAGRRPRGFPGRVCTRCFLRGLRKAPGGRRRRE